MFENFTSGGLTPGTFAIYYIAQAKYFFLKGEGFGFFVMDIGTIIFGIGAGLTWLIVILVLVQLSRFLAKFEQGRQELDSNIIGMAGQLKKLQTTVAEILIEQKRATRLTLEGLDLKKAEMTGDFEIVEEPVPGPGTLTPQSPVPPPPPISIPNQGGPQFPELLK